MGAFGQRAWPGAALITVLGWARVLGVCHRWVTAAARTQSATILATLSPIPPSPTPRVSSGADHIRPRGDLAATLFRDGLQAPRR